ncbi:MAG TPA: hypothetical protein VKB39_06770 [Candidatus Baltobacteraceae bacterium]|nr:hypothetical protein [Candidatus Baltobacteraceae bacterium]
MGSPGPQTGTGPKTRPGPARPIQVAPTPSPAPRSTPSSTPPNINAKLRALLPNNPVNPTMKQYTPTYSLRGRMEPTPPPDVLARTKYIYRSDRGTERVVMWVTDAHKSGLTTSCTGWLVRYPVNAEPVHAGAGTLHPTDIAPANGTQMSVGGGAGNGYLPPIVDGIVTQACEGRLLEPYAGLPASSP